MLYGGGNVNVGSLGRYVYTSDLSLLEGMINETITVQLHAAQASKIYFQ